MKKTEITTLRKKDIKDLSELVGKKRTEAVNAFSEMKAGRQYNVKKYKNIKKEIAQILTIIREKEIISNPDFSLEKKKTASILSNRRQRKNTE